MFTAPITNDSEYLKIFISDADIEYKENANISFCSKTMGEYLYKVSHEFNLDDDVFFISVELLNKYLTMSIISTFGDGNAVTDEEQNVDEQLSDQQILDKATLSSEQYIQNKHLLATACLQIAAKACQKFVDNPRLEEYLQEIEIQEITKDNLLETEIKILKTIHYQIPIHIPHVFISYFLRFFNDEISPCKFFNYERFHNLSMVILLHIYLKWDLLIKKLARIENGLTDVTEEQTDIISHRLKDCLLLGSSTILAASKISGLDSKLHNKIINLFVQYLGFNPMRIYISEFIIKESISDDNITDVMETKEDEEITQTEPILTHMTAS
ncbi:unnamed protein product [Didymodactylos carnosus]|uniref:Cyclin N-terminal domain-containing protein n=1 Tax=Didymodactylos carnosus TaxID=1234261 RepID=A0A813ZCL1_9BILA|nr:unnamed protein product [Didymodactylos carnosus]CAF0897498.1 unnamed protein product [Didymodactylos carnosus]CAF3526703.1 unnamed protein product [Didymodactylos carnosus]CAF3680548.1 unnamed protein product [Didymodactylos carnosus]